MILAITYGDDNFSQSNKYNLKTAIRYGKADKTILYGPNDLDNEFKEKNHQILSVKRGSGYWIWKPYIINKAMKLIDYGDYLVYADSGSFYTRNIKELINFIKKKNVDIFLGELEHKESMYSKRDAFVYIGVDAQETADSLQYEASFLLVQKSKFTEKFIAEWLNHCCDIRIISDNENTCGLKNYSDFKENRYDQTVLSLLAKKYRIQGYRPVDNRKTTHYAQSDYKQIIVRTRFRNCGTLRFRVKIILKWIDYFIKNSFVFR